MTKAAQHAKRRSRLAAASVLYFGALCAVAFSPAPVDRGAPGAALQRFLEVLHTAGVPPWLDYGLCEAAANVAFFLPVGLLLGAALSPRWTWLAAVAGICLSAAVEAGQALFLPDRVATPQDVLANSLGAALGTVAVYAWRTARRGRRTAA